MIAVSPQGIVRTFDAADGRALEQRLLFDRAGLSPNNGIKAELSADGRTVALNEHLADRRHVAVWDVVTGKLLLRRESQTQGGVSGFALSADGRKLAIAEDAGPLRVVDVPSGQTATFGTLDGKPIRVWFWDDGTHLEVTALSAPISATCYDLATGTLQWTRSQSDFDPTSLPSGRSLVTRLGDGLFTRDPQSQKLVRRVTLLGSSGTFYGPIVGRPSSDGRTVLTHEDYLQRWDLTTGKLLWDPPPDDGLPGRVHRLAFSADGAKVVASAPATGTAWWDAATGRRLQMKESRNSLTALWAATSNGPRIVSPFAGSEFRQVAIVDPVTETPIGLVDWLEPELKGDKLVRAYALTTDGKTLVIAHGGEPLTTGVTLVTACDAATGRRLSRTAHLGELKFPWQPFSPCGRWMVLAGKVCEVATGREVFVPTDGSKRLAADGPFWLSPDGGVLVGRVSANAGSLVAWEVPSGKVLTRFAQVGVVEQAAFAPDGRRLALVDGQGVTVCEWPGGRTVATFAAADVNCWQMKPDPPPQTLAFSPDGKRLATGHRDGTVLLWAVP